MNGTRLTRVIRSIAHARAAEPFGRRMIWPLASLLVAISLPNPVFGQQEVDSLGRPLRPKLEIRSIVCEDLKEKLKAATDEDRALCSGTAYTQRLKTCIAIAEKSISAAQAQLLKLGSCPDFNAGYANAIIANSRRNRQIFETYAAEVEKRAARPSSGRSDGAPSGYAAPRRCWVVSQQCQDCNVNGCFPYVCNSRTECE